MCNHPCTTPAQKTAPHLEGACCWERHAQLECCHCLLQRISWHNHALYTLVDQLPGPGRSQPAAPAMHAAQAEHCRKQLHTHSKLVTSASRTWGCTSGVASQEGQRAQCMLARKLLARQALLTSRSSYRLPPKGAGGAAAARYQANPEVELHGRYLPCFPPQGRPCHASPGVHSHGLV